MISLVNEFSALLDTCTILPIRLCDLLLKVAEHPALYQPKWSPHILEELDKNLREPPFNLSQEKTAYRIGCMTTAFPEAMITGYDSLIGSMPNNEKDRHVLAAAVYGKVDAIITVDRKGFPPEILNQFGIEPITPDDFLIHKWHLDEEIVRCRVIAQAALYQKGLDPHLETLARMVPKFVALVRESETEEPAPEE